MHFDDNEAVADSQRSKLQLCIEVVWVTRNWWAHGKVHAREITRAMSSLVDTLSMLKSLLPSSRQVHFDIVCVRITQIKERISEHSSGSAPLHRPLPLTSIVVVVFIRNWKRMCDAVDQPDLDQEGLKSEFRGSQEVKLHRNIAWNGRNYICHGKCSNKSLELLASLCSISWLLRKRKLESPLLTALQATIDNCDRDIQYLLAQMGLNNEQDVLRAVADSHQ
jgi:hypothetical protein